MYASGFKDPRTWSKQHHKLRIRRPITDNFNAAVLHPEKEWWKEKYEPQLSSFMGFPDLEAVAVRGGPACITAMDALTFATVTQNACFCGPVETV